MPYKVKLGIIISTILVLIVAGFSLFSRQEEEVNLTKEVDRNLTAEDRQIYEDRLRLIDEQLAGELADQDKWGVYMQQGYNLYGLGKLSESKNSFLQAAEVDPDNYNIYVAMYQTELEMGDEKAAQGSLEKALELNPASTDVWRKYIMLQQERLGASDEMVNDFYRDALAKTGNHVDIMTVYAQFLERMGNVAGALDMWEQAKTADPSGTPLYQREIDRINTALQ